jgi:hypothetical protein
LNEGKKNAEIIDKFKKERAFINKATVICTTLSTGAS